jgi:cytochrome b pre-mRNA-processing protein 3
MMSVTAPADFGRDGVLNFDAGNNNSFKFRIRTEPPRHARPILHGAAKPVNQLRRRCNNAAGEENRRETFFMFQRMFGRERNANRAITEALYASIVAAARQPVFYSDWAVPDTPLGRFEMLSLHMFMFQHRMHKEIGPSRDIAQILIDDFFTDVDHSLRELGIGDLGVPKRMKKLAKMYYGRTAAYDDALDRGDNEALAAALSRNIRPDASSWPEATQLADYVLDAVEALAAQDSETIRGGKVNFPAPVPG